MDRSELSLTALLDEINASLRRGDFSDLASLTAAMQAAEVRAQGTDPEELRQIRRLAERNARTMIAARRGIQAARRRIDEVMSAARGLVTYDRQGHRVEERNSTGLAQRF